MIPSIEDIIIGLIGGTITKEQATSWLALHMEGAEARGYRNANLPKH